MADERAKFWSNPANWPGDTGECVFLCRATLLVGKALFGEDWTGNEPTTPSPYDFWLRVGERVSPLLAEAAVLSSIVADMLDDEPIQAFARIDRQAAIGGRFQKVAGDCHPAALVVRRSRMAPHQARCLPGLGTALIPPVQNCHMRPFKTEGEVRWPDSVTASGIALFHPCPRCREKPRCRRCGNSDYRSCERRSAGKAP